jgi:drug/metabolite transporter (DMT)-like permease
MIVGAMCFLPFAFLHTESTSAFLRTEAWLAIGYMALFGSVISYIWWNEGISQLGAGKTSIFFNLVPVATMLVALITGSSLTLAQLVGALFVVTGLLMASRRSERPGHLTVSTCSLLALASLR